MARDEPEIATRLAWGSASLLDVPEQVRGRLGGGDARGDVGDVAGIALAEGEVRELCQEVAGRS